MGNLFSVRKLEETVKDMTTSINSGDWVFKSSWNNPLFVVGITGNQEIEKSSTSNDRQTRIVGPQYTVYEFDITSNSVVQSIIKGSASFWYRSAIGTDQKHIDSIIDKCITILNKKEYTSFKNGYDTINSAIVASAKTKTKEKSGKNTKKKSVTKETITIQVNGQVQLPEEPMSSQGQAFVNAARASQLQEEETMNGQDQAFFNAASAIQLGATVEVEENVQVQQQQNTSSIHGPSGLLEHGLDGQRSMMAILNGRPSFQEQVPRYPGDMNNISTTNNISIRSSNSNNSIVNNSNSGIGVELGRMSSGLDSITNNGINTSGSNNGHSSYRTTTIGMRQDNTNLSSSSSSYNNSMIGQQFNNNNVSMIGQQFNNNNVNSTYSINSDNSRGLREQNSNINRYSTSSSSSNSGMISSTSQSTIPNSSSSYNKQIGYTRGINNTNMLGNNIQQNPTVVRENEIPYTQNKLIILNPQGYNNPSNALFIDDYRLDRSLVNDLMNSTSRVIGHSTKHPGTKTPVVWVTDKISTWLLSVEEHEKVMTCLIMSRISEIGLVGETSDPNHYSEVIYRLVSQENTQEYYFHRIMSLSMANILSCAPDNREYVNKWKQMGHSLQITLKTKLTIGLQSRIPLLNMLFSSIGEEEIFKTVLNEFITNDKVSTYDKVLEAINDVDNVSEHVCLLFYAEKVMQQVGFIDKESVPEIAIIDCDMWGNSYSLHDISYVLTCLALGLVNGGVLKLREKLRRRTDNENFGPTLEEIRLREEERKALEDKVVSIKEIRNMYKFIENKMVRDFILFNEYMKKKDNLMRHFTQLRYNTFDKWDNRRGNKRIRIDNDNEDEEKEDNNDEMVKLRNKANELRSNRIGNRNNNNNTHTSTSSTASSNVGIAINNTSITNPNTSSSLSNIHGAYSTLSTFPHNRQVIGISHDNIRYNMGSGSGVGSNSMSGSNGLVGKIGDIGGNITSVLGNRLGLGRGQMGYVSGSNMDTSIGIGMDINNITSDGNLRWDDDNNECDLKCDIPNCQDNRETVQTCTECNVNYCQGCFDNHQDEHGVCASIGSRSRRQENKRNESSR